MSSPYGYTHSRGETGIRGFGGVLWTPTPYLKRKCYTVFNYHNFRKGDNAFKDPEVWTNAAIDCSLIENCDN
jgi:hypothetical protein